MHFLSKVRFEPWRPISGQNAFNYEEEKIKTEEVQSSTHEPTSREIETASYALLTYLISGRFDKAEVVARWLICQSNNRGGFVSTQVGVKCYNIVVLMCLLLYA